MPFSSLDEFEKWHESIQYRFNHASLPPGVKKTGAAPLSPPSPGDSGSRQHQQMAQRDGLSGPSVPSGRPLQPSEPTLTKKEAED